VTINSSNVLPCDAHYPHRAERHQLRIIRAEFQTILRRQRELEENADPGRRSHLQPGWRRFPCKSGTLELVNPMRRDPVLPTPGECPAFEEATNRFKAFLLQNGWPTDIVWVKSTEHLDRIQLSEARREYEFARHQGLGVCLHAIRVARGSAVAVVEYPRDSDESERLMYPSDGGLKLTVAATGRDG